MMQADREHNFNWPVNCPAVNTHEKGLLSVCIIIINIFHCKPKHPLKIILAHISSKNTPGQTFQ